jgi:solute carrier family 20 (sodium-dependent phosphate transporter)
VLLSPDDVANAWATSVSSRSVTYQQAMILCVVFELTGALTVGARTASTIKNGIIPIAAFNGNAGVQLLAFACAAAGAALWVQWCTRHSAHVSSTYSLVSSIAGVGVAAVGADKVQWGWNKGTGLGAIFAGLGMAPVAAGCFGAIIFSLIKYVVHIRCNPVPWAVWTSPFFFLIAGTICTLSIIYKGSPRLGLDKKPGWWIAAVTLGAGCALALLAALFFVPFVHARVIKKDQTLRLWDVFQGPLLFKRPAPEGGLQAKVPNYAVVQHGEDDEDNSHVHQSSESEETMIGTGQELKSIPLSNVGSDSLRDIEKSQASALDEQARYKAIMAEAKEKHHAELRQNKGPLGWAMRTLHKNRPGAGSLYELHNMKAFFARIPANIVVALLYGPNYDIHRAQVGIEGTPDGRRMVKVYECATKYPNESEYLYSFVQIITACTASFAHGANDVGNAVGVWAAMYSAWSTGHTVGAKAPVPLWQIAVIALTICIGFITYGYNIMRGKRPPKISPHRSSGLANNHPQSWATRSLTTPRPVVRPWKWARPSPSSSSRNTPCRSPLPCASPVPPSAWVCAMASSGRSTGSEWVSSSSRGS